MSNPNSNFYLPNQPEYNKEFWNYALGMETSEGYLDAGKKRTGGYVLPSVNDDRFTEALKKESLFRNIGTYLYSHEGSSKILAKHSDASASWIPDGGAIPVYDGMSDFAEFSLEDHKLAAVLKMDADFLHDKPHIFSNFFISRMARAFGKAENDGFINGTGVDMPTGILSDNGADTGVTATALTFDSVIQLYFSVDKNHRDNGAWLMNDEAALALRLLKDNSGNHLWNHANDTILGKPVYINNCMPSVASGAKPIAFGDFSFYWIVERDPLSVRVLKENFIESGQIGYIAYEFLDGKLIRPEAVKVLAVTP